MYAYAASGAAEAEPQYDADGMLKRELAAAMDIDDTLDAHAAVLRDLTPSSDKRETNTTSSSSGDNQDAAELAERTVGRSGRVRAKRTAKKTTTDGAAAMSTLDIRRKRNRDSMRRARIRQRAEKDQMQRMIDQLESQLRHLITRSETQEAQQQTPETQLSTQYTYSSYGRLLRQTDELRKQNHQLLDAVRQHQTFQIKLERETELEVEDCTRVAKQVQQSDGCPAPSVTSGAASADGLDTSASAHETPEDGQEAAMPGRPEWMSPSMADELLRFATDMFVSSAEQTDLKVTRPNLVLGWHDKRALLDNTWAQFLLTKNFPHESAAVLAARTWDATVNVAKLRGMLSWTAGMKVLHRLSDDAYIIARELHLPNSADPDHPILYRYSLLIYRASTPDGFIISTQNISLAGGTDVTVEQRLSQRLLRQSGVPLVTMYGFQFIRQCDKVTGDELGCRVRLVGRTSDGSLSYAHKVLTEALPSILRWENSYVGPILCITPSA